MTTTPATDTPRPVVHRRSTREDGAIAAACEPWGADELRVTSRDERITCPVCRPEVQA